MNGSHDDRALALLGEIDADGPFAVRTLLSRHDLCESDLHGLCAELRAAGLLAEAEVAGERGYRTTERAREALERNEKT
jgi:phage FluMu protein gp41